MSKKIIFCFFVVLFSTATVFAGTLCFFEGNVNFIQGIFQMQVNFKEKEKILTQLKFLANDNYYFNANLQHLKISNLDISTNLESTGRLLKDKSGSLKLLKGWFWSNYSLVNYKPFMEMSGAFVLDRKAKRLSISSFAWGNLEANGSIGLSSPHSLDLTLAINDMEVKDFTSMLGIPTEDIELEGLVSGKLKIEGIITNPKIRGQIRASKGNINEFKYQDIFVNVEGGYPLLNITDSSIIEEDGLPYRLEGRLDLRELNNPDSESHAIKISPSDEKNFNWQSWKISRKQLNDNLDSLSLDYKLKANRPFGIRFEDNQEILGIEHKIKF